MDAEMQSGAAGNAAKESAQNPANWLSVITLELLHSRTDDGCEMSLKDLRCAVHRVSRSAVTKRVMAVLAMLERGGLVYMTEPERAGHKRDSGRVGLTQHAQEAIAGAGIGAVLEEWYARQGNGWAAQGERGVRGGAPRRRQRRKVEVGTG